MKLSPQVIVAVKELISYAEKDEYPPFTQHAKVLVAFFKQFDAEMSAEEMKQACLNIVKQRHHTTYGKTAMGGTIAGLIEALPTTK